MFLYRINFIDGNVSGSNIRDRDDHVAMFTRPANAKRARGKLTESADLTPREVKAPATFIHSCHEYESRDWFEQGRGHSVASHSTKTRFHQGQGRIT